ncbi:MAG TPA: class I SAM-dependent methyltransferase [bacterium]|nr:class I SAM-dependent methyltransferase [bacterium]
MMICPDCRKPLEEAENGYRCTGCGAVFSIEEGVPVFAGPDSESADGFRDDFFEGFHRREAKHFWHTGRKNIIFRLVRKYYRPGWRMIELGCGSGNVVEYLNRKGLPVEGGDIFPSAIKFAAGKTKTKFFRIDILNLPFRDEYDAIGIFDVLEHIDDDRAALGRINEALKTGGLLFVTVPAGKALWSNFDEFYCHRRRYEKNELKRALEESGFRVLRLSHFVFLLYPLVAVTRKLSGKYRDSGREIEKYDAVKIVPVVNTVLSLVMMLESLLVSLADLPCGSSLVCVAKKEKDITG